MICVPINTNAHFQKISAVIVREIGNVNKFALITTAITECDIKSEYLFRTCSIATNPVTSFEFHSDLCLYAVPFLFNCGTVPYSLFLISIAALLQAVLPENTEPFLNNRVGNEEQNIINVSKRCAVKLYVNFSMKPWIPCIISCNLKILLVVSCYGKTVDLLFVIIFTVSARKRAFSCPFLTDQARPFSAKKWIRRGLWGKMDEKVFISRQSWPFPFVVDIIKVIFPILYLDLACKQISFSSRKRYK